MSFFPPTTKNDPQPADLVAPIDQLTLRWLSLLEPGKGTVFSPVGLWPLLAILADAATPPVQSELAGVLGLSGTHSPTAQALALLRFLHDTKGLSAAAGVWLARDIPPQPQFVAGLPPGMVEVLSGNFDADKAALAAWAHQALQGMLEVDIELKPYTKAYLASAVTLATRWTTQFYPDDGWLRRTTSESDAVRTCEAVTTVRVRGDDASASNITNSSGREVGAHDVHLVVGKHGAPSGEVLARGLHALRNLAPISFEDAQSATPGPGLTISIKEEMGSSAGLRVNIRTPQFRVEAKTQLGPRLCGLTAAMETEHGFPGISTAPLIFSGGSQTAMAEFTAKGFTAAAFTQMTLFGGGGGWHPVKTVHLDLNVDRPFGFLAVEQNTGLLLFAGWVTEGDCSWAAKEYRSFG